MIYWLVLLTVANAVLSSGQIPLGHCAKYGQPYDTNTQWCIAPFCTENQCGPYCSPEKLCPGGSECPSFSGSPKPVSCPDLSTTTKSPTVVDCLESLACHYADIDLWSMADRLTFIQGIEIKHGPSFGATEKFRNIEAIITFFQDNDMGASGSWVSYTDVGILEGIERGFAIALGLSTDDYGNFGANIWAGFLLDLKNGKLSDRFEHDYRWSIAEQNCTDYGAYIISPKHHAIPSKAESIWFKASEIYRWVMRNEEVLISSVPGFLRNNVRGFILWFTDVTNFKVVHGAAQLAWDIALAGVAIYDIGAAILFLILPYLYPKWIRETGGF